MRALVHVHYGAPLHLALAEGHVSGARHASRTEHSAWDYLSSDPPLSRRAPDLRGGNHASGQWSKPPPTAAAPRTATAPRPFLIRKVATLPHSTGLETRPAAKRERKEFSGGLVGLPASPHLSPPTPSEWGRPSERRSPQMPRAHNMLPPHFASSSTLHRSTRAGSDRFGRR